MHKKNHVNLMILKGNISIIRLEKDRDSLLITVDTYSFISLTLTL